jgi:putative heme-binding domain-containing protein
MPVFTTVGPDGALYVVDFYRKIVEHPEWIRKDLMNDNKLFYAGNDRGRIYRVVYEEAKPVPKLQLNEASTSQLVQELSHRNMWWRITAQRLLVERQDPTAIRALKDLSQKSPSAEGRMHALWTLEGMNALDMDLVLPALEDNSPAVREQAIRLAETYLSDARVVKKLLQMTNDPDDRVEFQLVCTLGDLPPTQSFEVLSQIAARHLEDPWFQTAVLTAASQNANRWLQAVLRRKDFVQVQSKGKEKFLRRITSIIGARQRDSEVSQVLEVLSKGEDEQWQIVNLEGLADGLKRGSGNRMKLSARGEQLLLRFLDSPTPLVGQAAFDVAARVQLIDSAELRTAIRKATRTVLDDKSEVEARAKAARVLGLDPTQATLPILERVFMPQQPEEIRLAAAAALLGVADSRSTDILLKQWKTYTARVRDAVLAGFFRQPRRVQALLDAVEVGKVQAWSLSRLTRQQLTQSLDEKIRKRAELLFANVSSDRAPIIEKYRPAMRMSGNTQRGMEVFKKNCSKCHKMGDSGFEVGPNLMTITRRSKEELLENILDPNANIVPGYEEYVVQTKDGTMITGVIANHSATTLTLRRGAGQEDTVLLNNIADLRSLTVSAMPEDLENAFSVEEMADLLEYLRTFVGTKKAQAAIHGHF